MKQLDIPSRYKVFCIVSLGYPKENAQGRDQKSQRFDMKDVYFQNKFGVSFWNTTQECLINYIVIVSLSYELHELFKINELIFRMKKIR